MDIDSEIKSYLLREFLPNEDPASLGSDTPLLSTNILDSLAVVKLVAWMEATFAIRIAGHESDADNLDTIDKIAALVRKKRA